MQQREGMVAERKGGMQALLQSVTFVLCCTRCAVLASSCMPAESGRDQQRSSCHNTTPASHIGKTYVPHCLVASAPSACLQTWQRAQHPAWYYPSEAEAERGYK